MPAFGHLGIGLVTKRFEPQIPLWTLLLSTMIIDILAVIFITAPLWWTHGLIMALVWSGLSIIVVIFTIKLLNYKNRQNDVKYSNKRIIHSSVVIGVLVFSHWVHDLIGWSMWSTAIPLFFNDTMTIMLPIQTNLIIGLILVEFGPFIFGLIVYVHYLIKIKRNNEIN